MSTRCWIGVENADKTVEAIYCHSAGYPHGVGRLLFDSYQDREKVNKLLAIGPISILVEHVESGEGLNQSFDAGKRIPNVCLSFPRDRRGKNDMFNTIKFHSVDDMIGGIGLQQRTIQWIQWIYILTPDGWIVFDSDLKRHKLEDVLPIPTST